MHSTLAEFDLTCSIGPCVRRLMIRNRLTTPHDAGRSRLSVNSKASRTDNPAAIPPEDWRCTSAENGHTHLYLTVPTS